MILENAKQILEDLTSSKSSAKIKIVTHQPGGLGGTPGYVSKKRRMAITCQPKTVHWNNLLKDE